MKNNYSKIRLILGDQLNANHSWFKNSSEQTDCLYLIAELPQETTYVKHHEQKILAFFASMQAFAKALSEAGFDVLHLTLDESCGYGNLPDLLSALLNHYACKQFEYQQPDEYRLADQLSQFQAALSQQGILSFIYETEHFLVAQTELENYFSADKNQRMETFYRKMRKRYDLLMQGDKPQGDKWNYDADNRKKLNKQDIANLPSALVFSNDVSEIRARLEKHQVQCFGQASDQLLWPINRTQALTLLDHFCRVCLPLFGHFQDAMTCKAKDAIDDKQWSLYHSRLSFVLNAKILHPLQVVKTAIEHYEQNPSINLAQVEGFVRQIIGWREFVRGVYWTHMPHYQNYNHLKAERDLPNWFWTAETKMNCLHHAIKQSLDYAYAHHIQRLMVTGNFCLIAGIQPDQVDAWYLGIYIDAIEWVEMPNTRGMSQFADGGIVGSKPYAASGNYTNKMTDYCSSCQYDVKQKLGDNACPLNSLYWQFMIKHRELLAKNPRIGMVYRNWDKQAPETQQHVLQHAQKLLANLDQL
ncbi:cryptochrome/photolyase family protein [Catenovulum sp. SM1970]|nr:cryptochrome/photolyase family protein [Marinifaba aquimaris]NTS76265.1 cryptochrome/photolyase family protein [Marinifaba aquimaris]